MKILWVNSATTKTLSNTRLFGMPPVFIKWGHPTLCLIGGKLDSSYPDYFVTLPVPLGRIGLYRLLAIWTLPLVCLKHKPDVIITDWMSAKLTRWVVVLRKLGLLKCKLVHDVRTVPVKDDRGKSYSIYAGSLKYARKQFDGITTITLPLREEICSEFGFSPQQIAVWTSGVDIDHFRLGDGTGLRKRLGLEGKFIVFYHGSINENRGVVELALAAEHLTDLDELRIIIVGGGNQWEKLKTVVDEKNLKQVLLQPGVPYKDIPGWISMADLCAVPLPDHAWWRVSSPLKLMEYLAMGKPVLLTDMKAHRAVLPEDDEAFYIKEATPEEFASGIRRAVRSKGSFECLRKNGRRKAETELTWESQAKVLNEYLDKVIKGEVDIRIGL